MFMMNDNRILLGDKYFDIIMNAAGCRSKTKEQLYNLVHNGMNTIVSKTCTLDKNNGNAEPNFRELNDNVSINCLGMPNYGYTYYRDLYLEFQKLNTEISNNRDIFDGITYIISMDASNSDELCTMLLDYDKFISLHGYRNLQGRIIREFVEINVSCPNKLDQVNNSTSRIIAYDPLAFSRLMETIRLLDIKNLDFGIKLSPYVDKILLEHIAKILLSYSESIRIKYIVCGNSIPNGMIMNLDTKQPLLSVKTGGISGTANKLLGVSNVYQFSNIFHNHTIENTIGNTIGNKIIIIGCGGIESDNDVLEYLSAGASIVQIGRILYLDGVSKVNHIWNNLKAKL